MPGSNSEQGSHRPEVYGRAGEGAFRVLGISQEMGSQRTSVCQQFLALCLQPPPPKAHLQPVAQHLHLNVCWITWAPKDQLMLGSGPNASPACVLAPMPRYTWLLRPKPWKLPLSKACWLYLLLPSPQPKLLTSRTWMPPAATHPPQAGILASGCLFLQLLVNI